MSPKVTPDKERAPEIEKAIRNFFARWKTDVMEMANSVTEALRTGGINLDSNGALERSVEYYFGDFTIALEETFRVQSLESAKAGRKVAVRRHNLGVSFDVFDKRILDVLEHWPVTASKHVANTLQSEVTQYLKGAHQEGLSVDEIANDFQNEFIEGRVLDSKARQLARDSTIGPSNGGRLTSYQDAGIFAKEWEATDDKRTRHTHNVADNQIVAMDNTFIVGGYEAMFPGDPSLPVQEFTNCRCTLIPLPKSQLTASQISKIQAGQRIGA